MLRPAVGLLLLSLAAVGCSSCPAPDAAPPRVPEDGGLPPSRPTAQACSSPRPAGNPPHAGSGCTSDVQCTAGLNGRCEPDGTCSYDQCTTDADCGSSGVCFCREGINERSTGIAANTCVPAQCHVDGDCGQGWCSPSYGTFIPRDSSPPNGFYCHLPGDACFVDSDCPAAQVCLWGADVGKWTCAYITGAG